MPWRRQRPLATGAIGGSEALIGFAVIMLIAFGLVLLTNRLTVYYSLAALALAVFYPYSKRLIFFPQVVRVDSEGLHTIGEDRLLQTYSAGLGIAD